MILVTGATGLLGSHLLFQLTQAGRPTRALFREADSQLSVKAVFKYYGDNNLAQYRLIEWIQADVLDYDALEQSMQGVDVVYHCAAMVSFHAARHRQMWDVNVEGTIQVVEAARTQQVGVLCHVSTIGTLGSGLQGEAIDEENLWQPDDRHSAYSRSKFRAEMEVWRASKEGMNVVIVNPSVIIGPGAAGKSSNQITRMSNAGMPFYTSGLTGYVDARDVAKAMILLVEQKQYDKRFIVSAENLSAQTLMGMFAQEMGKKAPHILARRWMLNGVAALNRIYAFFIRTEPLLTGESVHATMGRSRYSSAKLIETLQFEFVPIKTSVQNAVAFFRTTQNHSK